MRCAWIIAAASTVATLALAGGPLWAVDEPPAHDCDRLAAAPGTVAGIPGVALEDIDAAAAVAACERAVRDHPGVLRFVFQYGRAAQRAGDGGAAAWLYAWAAGEGYAAAQYALGRMLQAGDGVPADAAAAERWLAAAAAQGYPTDGETPAATGTAAADPSPPLPALADSLERVAAVLDEVRAGTSRTRFDLVAAQQAAGSSVEALTAWIGREVALVSYRGSLRGARGTLMDRYGNSLDRALLLAELLGAAGFDARLARATLDATTAAALLDGFAPPPADEPAGDAEALVARLTAAAGPEGAALVDGLTQARTDATALDAAVRRRSADLTGDLLAILGSVPVAAAGAARADAVAALQDHWWVQVRQGLRWADADPSAATVGPIAAEEAFAADGLPEDLRHGVTLRLIVEFWQEGRLREETVLEQMPASTPSV